MRFRFPYTFFKRKAKNGKNIYYFRVWDDTRHVRVSKTADWIFPIGCAAYRLFIMVNSWYLCLFHSALADCFLPAFSVLWQQWRYSLRAVP